MSRRTSRTRAAPRAHEVLVRVLDVGVDPDAAGADVEQLDLAHRLEIVDGLVHGLARDGRHLGAGRLVERLDRGVRVDAVQQPEDRLALRRDPQALVPEAGGELVDRLHGDHLINNHCQLTPCNCRDARTPDHDRTPPCSRDRAVPRAGARHAPIVRRRRARPLDRTPTAAHLRRRRPRRARGRRGGRPAHRGVRQREGPGARPAARRRRIVPRRPHQRRRRRGHRQGHPRAAGARPQRRRGGRDGRRPAVRGHPGHPAGRPRRAGGRDLPRRHHPLPALPGLAGRGPDRGRRGLRRGRAGRGLALRRARA